ncbi:hypothetical protein, partial [Klebsiella pneumoniae]|uniref:hypothetical protein n=1 Tax=Klebsiella pneumoniae TaxID=573 RepID=UPI00405591DB
PNSFSAGTLSFMTRCSTSQTRRGIEPRLWPSTQVCGASDSGTYPTRLETRTKESSVCASHWVLKPKGEMKVSGEIDFYV